MPEPIVPPQNIEAEENVIGAMLISASACDVVSEILRPEDFYRPALGTIFTTAVELRVAGVNVDAITITDALEKSDKLQQVGGRARIHELVALVPAAGNAAHHAEIVAEMAILRRLVRAGQEVTRLGQERPGETAELVDRAEQLIFEIGQKRRLSDFTHIAPLVKDGYDRVTYLSQQNGHVVGIPSGFRELDRLTLGFEPGNLIILAARPSMGKSALALCVASNLVVRHQIPVGLFTLEMSQEEITQRLISIEGRIESQKLRSGSLSSEDWQRMAEVCDRLAKTPLHVDDSASITMMELRSKARRLKAREPDLGLLIVDYLQLMNSGSHSENRVQEVSQITRNLKVLARDLGVPILALSQLSRAVESRHDKRPILSDLRESGSIEQDADLVMFIYRDEFYNGEDSDQQGLAELCLAKHRNGPTDTIKLSFVKRFARFSDLAHVSSI